MPIKFMNFTQLQSSFLLLNAADAFSWFRIERADINALYYLVQKVHVLRIFQIK